MLRLYRPDDSPYLTFEYRVVRAWQKPVEAVLVGGLGTLPLAPLAAVAPDQLPSVIRRMGERFGREVTPDEARTFWAATYLADGLALPGNVVKDLLQGVGAMRESATYQAVLDEGRAEGWVEGRAEEAKRILLRQGQKRFGPPDARTRAALEATTDLERIEQLAERLLDVASWDELLATP